MHVFLAAKPLNGVVTFNPQRRLRLAKNKCTPTHMPLVIKHNGSGPNPLLIITVIPKPNQRISRQQAVFAAEAHIHNVCISFYFVILDKKILCLTIKKNL
jgi:hypothetical protein